MKPALFVLTAVVLAGAGCSKAQWEKAQADSKTFEYHPDTEIPKGPGLFTGKKGAWVLEPPGDLFKEKRDPAKPRKE